MHIAESPMRLQTAVFILIIATGIATTDRASAQLAQLQNEMYLNDPELAASADDGKATVKPLTTLSVTKYKSLAVPKTEPQFEAATRQFIDENAKELGVKENEAPLTLKTVRSSLTGTFVEYEQTFAGKPILNSQLGVSLDPKGDVSSVTKSIFRAPSSTTAGVAKEAKLTQEQALDIVKADLKPAGKTLEPPSVTTSYLPEKNTLTLVYVVKVAVEQPFGYWEYRIDSQTGRVVEKFNRAIERVKRAGHSAPVTPSLPPLDLNESLKAVAPAEKALIAASIVTAKGSVFAPNPVTSLNNGQLNDTSPAASFKSAYKVVDLEGVTKIGDVLHLKGPTVRLEDFEPGEGGVSRPPATVTDKWGAPRGENAFNDIMTFYYLTRSIEYLRKLGYKGATELFKKGIAADSDGLIGDDNSHYVPGSDRLAFGHGCVDDNEDTDVILHELGHAIHYHINPKWGGGDSAAIGEGFGDYWAVSYRMKLASGMVPDPGKVFPWDGVSSCWGGRRVDVKAAFYDPSIVYEDHVPMEGFQSDELWGTPLVEAAQDIVKKGGSLEDVDKIVLEGMFGIGTNFTMPKLAANTVLKAKQLFPGKPYAAIFTTRFKQHKILK
jgi:zinc metalloprotease ZmpB